MTGATLAYVAVALLAMILPVAALRQRGLNTGQMIKAAAFWIALFVVVALVFSGTRL